MKKLFGLILSLWIGWFSFYGCQSQPTPPQPSPTSNTSPNTIPTNTIIPTARVIKGTVTIWHSWNETQRSVLFRQISLFQSQYPDVQFDVWYVPPLDLQASFEDAMSQGAGPSILIAPAEMGPILSDEGYIQEITDLVSDKLTERLNPAAVEEGVYNYRRIGLPISLKGVVLFRNKSIIPAQPSTFEQLVAFATSATANGKVGADLERSFYFSGAHLMGLGGLLMDADGMPMFQQDDYKIAQQWLFLLKEFEKAGMTEFNSDNDVRLFKDNRIGLIIDGTWNMYNLAGEIGPLNLAIDPWPTYQNGHLSGFVQSDNIYLTSRAKTEENQISWLFMQSLYTTEAQLSLADAGMIPPIRVSVVENGAGAPQV
ncbi:MAG: sugar ABC transporter substrate-binding protein, partial [Anaerolineales bacterium]